MSPPLKLCINADDFGLSRGVNSGILELIGRGVVTSTSVLTDGPAFSSGIGALVSLPVSVGLHFSLGRSSTALSRRNMMEAIRAQCGLGGKDIDEILRAQFETLCAHAGSISHIDSHEHIHVLPKIRSSVRRLAERAGIYWRVPREVAPRWSLKSTFLAAAFAAETPPVAFFGTNLMGFRMNPANIESQLDYLEAKKVNQAFWMVHPGCISEDHPQWDSFRIGREHELKQLLAVADLLTKRCRLVTLGHLLGRLSAE